MAMSVQYPNEYSKLTHVALYRPRLDEIEQGEPHKVMYSSVPDAELVLKEFDEIVAALQRRGVKVMVLDGSMSEVKTPNMIYLRDVAFVYGEKIIVARMKHKIREPEPAKFLSLFLRSAPELSFNIVQLPSGTMEGADLLVDDHSSLFAYTGSRTTKETVDNIKQLLHATKVVDIPANIDDIPQHLLGGIHIIGPNLVTRRVEYCKDVIVGYQNICFEENEEISKRFALNIVTLGPKEILMPANCKNTKEKLEKLGITCHEVKINEIHKMGGGLACMVLPLARQTNLGAKYNTFEFS